MSTKSRITAALAAASMLLLVGCAQKKNVSDDGTRPPVTTASVTEAEVTGDPREVYLAEGEKASELLSLFCEKFPSRFPSDSTAGPDGQASSSKAVFTGFVSHYAMTPELAGRQNTTIIPIFSQDKLHEYFHQNANLYDLTALAEYASYDNAFFDDKALLILALSDPEGAASYNLVGAFSDTLSANGLELDELVFVLEKTSGDATVSHFIIEMDKRFLNEWMSFSVCTYE